MILELNDEERAALTEILDRELYDLAAEVRHTDSREYRDELKARRKLIQDLLERLSSSQPQ